jgi:hypothetical protein
VAVVRKPEAGWVAIDRHERVLYHLFSYDNGPDYLAEGVRRINFADSASGGVVLAPPVRSGVSLHPRPGQGRQPLPGAPRR